MREIEQAEKAVADHIKSMQKVRDRLSRARKQVESGKQLVLALESLAVIKSFEKSYLFFIFCFIIIAFSFNFDFFWQKASNLNLIDSDDLMRILRVREIFEGKNFYDNIEQRVNAPNGASIHWSRIADFPLYIFQIFARFFTNPQNAENLAIIFVPIILGLIFIFFLGQTAYKLSNSKLSFLYALCLVPIFSTTAYNFQIGRLDHHSLQLILVLGLFYSLIENNFKHGFLGGFCLAISIANWL